MKILSEIKALDFLGCSMPFKIEGAGKHKTYYGGCISFMYYVLFYYYLFYFAITTIIQRRPSGYSEMHPGSPDDPISLNLTENPFIYGVRLENFKYKVLDTSDLLYGTFWHFTLDRLTGEQKQIPIKSIPCDKVIPDSISQKLYNTSSFICPDFEDLATKNISLNLEGDYEANKFSLIQFSYSLCNHDANNFKCKDSKNIEKLYNESTIWVSSLLPRVEYIIDNYTNPYRVSLTNQYDVLSPFKSTIDEFFLLQNELASDYDLMGFSKQYEYKHGFVKRKAFTKNERELIVYGKQNEANDLAKNSIIFSSIVLENTKLYHFRSYHKLGDFAALVIGKMKIFSYVAIFLSEFYQKIKFKEFLFKNLMVIDDCVEDSEKKILSKEEIDSKLRLFFTGSGDIRKKENEEILSLNSKKENERLKENDNEQVELQKIYSNSLDDKEKKEEEKIKGKAEVIQNDLKSKEDIRNYFQRILEHFRQRANTFSYGLLENLKYIICKKEKIKNTQKIINFYIKKIGRRFDILYYLKELKTLKIVKNTIFSEEKHEMIKIASNKQFKIDMREGLKDKKTSSEKDLKNLNYLLENYNPKNDTEEQRIMNNLIKLD